MRKFSFTKFQFFGMQIALMALIIGFICVPDVRADDNTSGLSDSRISELSDIVNDKYEDVGKRTAACTALGMPDCSSAGLEKYGDGAAAAASASSPSGASKAADGKTACDSAYSLATSACLLPGVEGMDPGSAAMFTMLLTQQLPSLASQITSIGKNMSQQCQAQADVQKVMTAINGIKGAACATTISTCRETCETETTEAKSASQAATARYDSATATKETTKAGKATAHGNKCAAYTTQVVQMMMAAMQNGVQMVANGQCAKDLAAFNAAPPTSTPPTMTQIGGCEDPNNQTLACYCTRPGNATSAMCSGFSGGGLAGGGTSTTPNGSTVAAPYAQTVLDTGDGNTVDPFANPAKKSGDGKGPGDGGSGAPGGGGIASFGSEGGGSGAGGTPLSAITGTSGGTGSGLGGSGGGGGGGLARNNGKAAGGGSLMDKFNLKRFLPGSKYKTRGIAGMSVKSVDGITGPMGPSLFEKATRQYQEQIQKQSVILDK
ncbi:hypothetical protein BH10BDE1_BH10BDE1_29690 [soil metagenome]